MCFEGENMGPFRGKSWVVYRHFWPVQILLQIFVTEENSIDNQDLVTALWRKYTTSPHEEESSKKALFSELSKIAFTCNTGPECSMPLKKEEMIWVKNK